MKWLAENIGTILFAAIFGGMIAVYWFKAVTGALVTKRQSEQIADNKIAVFKVYVDNIEEDREKAQLGITLSIEALSDKIDLQSAKSDAQQDVIINMMPDKKE